MTKIEMQQKILRLEAEVAALKAQPKIENRYHYHYPAREVNLPSQWPVQQWPHWQNWVIYSSSTGETPGYVQIFSGGTK